jgi:hypothetical protein
MPSPRIAQLILCNDLTIGGVYAMELPTAGAEHGFVIIAINVWLHCRRRRLLAAIGAAIPDHSRTLRLGLKGYSINARERQFK